MPPDDAAEGGTTDAECPTCVDLDQDGYGIGANCLGVDCDDRNPARFEGCRYIGPGGSDEGPGTAEQPWGTFPHALANLAPGDSLILLDGEYRIDTTGLPDIDCAEGGNARSGTMERPISLTAANAREAYLRSDGSVPALRLRGCDHWNLTDVAGRSDDFLDGAGYVLEIVESFNIAARGLLFSHNNRYARGSLYLVWRSGDILIEDSEAYTFQQTGVGVLSSDRVTLRRLYLNTRDYEALPNSPEQTPHFGVSLAGADHLLENVILEGSSGTGILFSGSGTRILGSIVIGFNSGISSSPPDSEGSVEGVRGTRLENVIVDQADEIGIYLRTPVDGTLRNVTVMNSGDVAALVREDHLDVITTCASAGGCSFEARNLLMLDNTGGGFYGLDPVPWFVSHSNAAGNGDGAPESQYNSAEPIDDADGKVQNSINESVADIGRHLDQCIVFIPETSSMHGRGLDGQDIGANILYRYESGFPTETPLWNPETGEFPCGKKVIKVSDVPSTSCFDVHERLNVGAHGCELPRLAPASACGPG